MAQTKSKPKAKAKRVSPGKVVSKKNAKSSSKLPSMFAGRYGKLMLVVIVFALIGLGTLIYSLAAVPSGNIKNKATGKCLENFFGRQLDGNFISTFPCQSGNKSQVWYVNSTDKSIRTEQNYCLDVQKGGKAPMTKVHLWHCAGIVGQKWDILSTGQLRNPNSMLCLEAGATNTFLGGPAMFINTCNSSNTRQIWSVPTSVLPLPPPPPTNPTEPTIPTGAVDVKSACKNTSSLANGTQVRPQYANDASTGPEVGGVNEDKLRSSGHTGRWIISQDGAVVDGVYHNGIITVTGNNVTIKNSVICGTGNYIVTSSGQNLNIVNSIIRGERGTSTGAKTGEPCTAAVGAAGYTIRKSELSGCADGVKWANTIAVYDSFFHDNYAKRGIGGVAGGGTHNDTVQKNDKTAGTSLTFKGNAAYQDPCTSNRHFQLKSVIGGSAASVVIEDNFFYGIRVVNFDGYSTRSGSFTNNVMAGSAARGPFSTGDLYAGTGGTFVPRGNVFESGQPANSNPSGYTCAAI